MKLETFLAETDTSDADFAARIGVSRSMVTKLRHRTAKPSAATALEIEKATRGKVKLADLMKVEGGSNQGAAA